MVYNETRIRKEHLSTRNREAEMIYDRLYEWQKRIVDEFSCKHRFGLFLDMGLGKTPLSLALAERNECTKVIVITINAKTTESKDVEGSWRAWTALSGINYQVSTKSDLKASESSSDLFLINYEALFSREKNSKVKVKLRDCLVEFINTCINHNVAVIIDESHKMKDIQSRQTKAINRIIEKLEIFSKELYVYLLTGTPFTTGYIDLYSQLKTLGYSENKTTFMERFCERGQIPGLLGWQQPIVGYKNIKQLFEVIHQYAITIESKDVINLPEQLFINHELKMTPEVSRFTRKRVKGVTLYNYLKKEQPPLNGYLEISTEEYEKRLSAYNTEFLVNNPFYRDIGYDIRKRYPTSKWLAETTGSFWLRSRELSIGFIGNEQESIWYNKNRLKEIKEFLQEHPDNYLLFYNFTPELLELYPICEELGYNIDVYCGLTKSLVFYEKYASQSTEQRLTNKKNIILANFASGSTGLNWQLYNKCIIFSLPLYKDWAQGIKRIHRTGQKNTVFYHIFYQNNWLDRGMKKALEEGIDYSNKMFESDLAREKEIMK